MRPSAATFMTCAAFVVVAGACESFGDGDGARSDDAGLTTDGATGEGGACGDGGGVNFCSTYVPKTAAGACLDFDDGKLPVSGAWIPEIKLHVPTVVSGGAHGSRYALELAGNRPNGGENAGAGIRRGVDGKPTTMALAASVFPVSVTGDTYDIFVVSGDASTVSYGMELELDGTGTTTLIEYKKPKDPDAGPPETRRDVAVFASSVLPGFWTDIRIELTVTGSTSSSAKVFFDGVQRGGELAVALHDLVTLGAVTWGDPSTSQGIDYRVRMDDFTFEQTP